MSQETVLKRLAEVGALITNSHLVYTSGRHGSAYVNKDALYTSPWRTSEVCVAIARHFDRRSVQVVVAPAVGGVALTQWTAYHINSRTMTHDVGEVRAVYAEKDGDGFSFKRGYGALISGKAVLVIEDILTTGGSVKKVVDAVRALGGDVLAVAVLCNRGGITAVDLDISELVSLTSIPLESWGEDECPLCQAHVPINTTVGKGQAFLDRKAMEL